jgi:hypothetical protein
MQTVRAGADFIALSSDYGIQARSRVPQNASRMEIVCVIGERLYHRPGSDCHRELEKTATGPLLSLTAAQAHEVGMEPCGVCLGDFGANH